MKKSCVFLAVLAMTLSALGILCGAPRSVALLDVLIFTGGGIYVFWQLWRTQ
jgi:hypothetical protein